MKIVLVDDSPEFLESATRLLETDSQIEVIATFVSGAEALPRLSDLKPDWVLVDLSMPEMSGLDLLRSIKQDPMPPQVAILTLYSGDEYQRAALAAGADLFIGKDRFDENTLALFHKPEPVTADRRILVVDDSPTIRRMVTASLRCLPSVTFDEAANGLEAIEKIAILPVDLMILDINMPDMHGLDVLKFLRNRPQPPDLAIAVLTTRSDDDMRQKALAAGADAYITKPFSPETIVSEAQRLLARETKG